VLTKADVTGSSLVSGSAGTPVLVVHSGKDFRLQFGLIQVYSRMGVSLSGEKPDVSFPYPDRKRSG
jgi:hypothetical protein